LFRTIKDSKDEKITTAIASFLEILEDANIEYRFPDELIVKKHVMEFMALILEKEEK